MKDRVFIWDMDGTLIDSYTAIVATIREMFENLGVRLDPDEIRQHVTRYSVGSYLDIVEKRTGKTVSQMPDTFARIEEEKNKEITLMRNAYEILDHLGKQGYRNFIFTHRGPSTFEILKRCGIEDRFTETVTRLNGFPRKPEPDGLVYLINKYGLDKTGTFYVGDRSIDMECAANAGIGGILYHPEGSFTDPTGTEKYIIKDFLEMKEIFR